MYSTRFISGPLRPLQWVPVERGERAARIINDAVGPAARQWDLLKDDSHMVGSHGPSGVR